MRRTFVSSWLGASAFICGLLFSSEEFCSAAGWQTARVHQRFFTEGASTGDINADGVVDIVAGPLWYEGPAFTAMHEIAPPKEFPVAGYSDQFFSEAVDVNADGNLDVLVIGFPGRAARLYLHPGQDKLDQTWQTFEITGAVDNESPAIIDLIPGGLPEIVCGRDGQYGFYAAGEDATQPWRWKAVSRAGTCGGMFAHGMGVGDVNGDGRLDLLDKTLWWEHPATADGETLWTQHTWATEPYGGGGAQICVGDIDGDGDADIVTSRNAHGYGLSWFEQTSPGTFVRHDIMGETSIDNPHGVAFSQLHAVALADIDGDGCQDIVTGKRYRAHAGKDPGGLQAPVLYWFRCQRSAAGGDGDQNSAGGVEFIPHLIDDDSGVGTEVIVTDLNGDGRLDVVSSSKRGLTVHQQDDSVAALPPERWRVDEGRDQEQYADGWEPAEAAAEMLLPEGFAVDLIAAEPELTQPIAMCFDDRGRIWVLEGHTYPRKAPAGEGKDRIRILEDSDANGSFETQKTFAEGINLASGIEVGFGGVWVGAAPELLFFPDANRDDVPDAEPMVLLDGFGYQDTHETLNSFTWGPDGWLYGCHGVFTHSRVGKPGTPDAQREAINAGIWRYHPTEHRFEVFAHGSSNPWGLDFNEQGDWFIEACVIPHLFHIQQGARYQRQAGQHFNPHTYADIQTIADHLHYSGSIRDHAFWGDNQSKRPAAALNTSLLGGGHAHCGLAIYNGDAFPPEYREQLFIHNLHGHRIVREHVEREGSGYIGRHRPDFALSRDHQQIGVSIMVGPDGALYTSDWHDPQTCHNRTPEVWNRNDGRLFRMRYGDARPYRFDLSTETDEQLLGRLSSDNGFFARQAQRILQERAAAETLQLAEVREQLQRLLDPATKQRDRLRGLWTRAVIGDLSLSDLESLLTDHDPYIRGWAVHFVGQRDADLPAETHRTLVELSRREPSPVVRRYLASLLQRLPLAQRWEIAAGLAAHSVDLHDRNIPLLVWYGIEPLADVDPQRLLELAENAKWPDLLRFTVRRTAVTAEGRNALATRLLEERSKPHQQMILEELLSAATSRAGVAMPPAWPKAVAKLGTAENETVRSLVRKVAVQFGDKSILPFFRKALADTQQADAERLAALEALQAVGDPELPQQLLRLLDDSAVARAAVTALARYAEPRTPAALLSRFAKFDAATQTAALNTLVARQEYARELVAAMEAGTVLASSVPAFVVRQAVSLEDAALTSRLEAVWGKISTSSAEKAAQYKRLRTLLTGAAYENADRSRGRVLYEANCGKCHRLFGTGGEIGPDITGANRTDVHYWLENILEPNALIGRDYQLTKFLLDDGRVVNGIIKSENEDAVTVQTATEQAVLAVESIEQRVLSETSLMPAGQLEPLTDQQIRELLRYLTGPTQVSLPDQGDQPSEPYVRDDGTLVVEGEWLLKSAVVDAGSMGSQGMQGFGPEWSGDHQLWWTQGKPQASLKFTVSVPRAGKYDLSIFLTQAVDYAQLRIGGTGIEPQAFDGFASTVRLAKPVQWQGVEIDDDKQLTLELEVSGANPQAIPRYMVGLDRLELQLVP